MKDQMSALSFGVPLAQAKKGHNMVLFAGDTSAFLLLPGSAAFFKARTDGRKVACFSVGITSSFGQGGAGPRFVVLRKR